MDAATIEEMARAICGVVYPDVRWAAAPASVRDVCQRAAEAAADAAKEALTDFQWADGECHE